MRLYLIRHAETVDNVANLYAGSRDSELTNHGVLQAQCLANYICKTRPSLTHIFSSPLHRAVKTAYAIQAAQVTHNATRPTSSPIATVTRASELVEQDFGSLEGKGWAAKQAQNGHPMSGKRSVDFVEAESKESMIARCEAFLDQYLMPLFETDSQPHDLSVVVVSHGMLLSHLWRRLLLRLPPKSVKVSSEATAGRNNLVLEHLGGWHNTGFLELMIRRTTLLRSSSTGSARHELKKKRTISGTAHRLAKSQELPRIDEDPSTSAPVSDEGTPSASPSHKHRPSRFEFLGRSKTTGPPTGDAIDESKRETLSPQPTSLQNHSLVVLTINGQEHLKGLKRTRGGIGSSRSDSKQKTIDDFLKKTTSL